MAIDFMAFDKAAAADENRKRMAHQKYDKSKLAIRPVLPENVDRFDVKEILSHFQGGIYGQIESLEKLSNSVEVVDQDTSAVAAGIAASTKAFINELGKGQKQITEPYRLVKSTIDTECRELKIILSNIVKHLEAKNRDFLIAENNRKKKAFLEAAKAAAALAAKREEDRIDAQTREDINAAEKGVEPVEIPAQKIVQPIREDSGVITDTGKQALKTVTVWELIDVRLVPEDILTTREKQIKSALAPEINRRIKAGITEIGGVKIRQEQVVKTTFNRGSK